jgi:hypothetical protein
MQDRRLRVVAGEQNLWQALALHRWVQQQLLLLLLLLTMLPGAAADPKRRTCYALQVAQRNSMPPRWKLAAAIQVSSLCGLCSSTTAALVLCHMQLATVHAVDTPRLSPLQQIAI